MADTIRTFIAVELSVEAKEELCRVESELKKADADIKWVDIATMHLTVKFIGPTQEEGVPKISRELELISSGREDIRLGLGGIGVFPKWDFPKVVWVGIDAGAAQLASLAKDADLAMSGLGFPEETRQFSPHITLGRVRGPRNKDKLKSIAESVKVAHVVSNISKIVLFRSDLTPKGAIHTVLSEHEFHP